MTNDQMRVLNVLQLIPTLDRSGAEKQMVLLATGLPRERFRVEVATLTRLGPLEGELRGAGGAARAARGRAAGRECAGHGAREAVQARSAGVPAPGPIPPSRAVRRDSDLDL